MVIVLGDNGTLGTTVKLPFDSSRAKGTAYQTGVWVPLIVAGPLVEQSRPHRLAHGEHRRPLRAVRRDRRDRGRPAGGARGRSTPSPCCPTSSNPEQRASARWNFTQIGAEPAGQRRHQRPLRHRQRLHADPRLEERLRGQQRRLVGAGHDDPSTVDAPPAGCTDCCQAVADLIGQDPTQDITIQPLSRSPFATITTRSCRTPSHRTCRRRSRASTSRRRPSSTRSTSPYRFRSSTS